MKRPLTPVAERVPRSRLRGIGTLTRSWVGWLALGGICLVGSSFLLACGGGPEVPYIQSEERTTEALITIKRSVSALSAERVTPDASGPVPDNGEPSYSTRSQAYAVAHFVSSPQYSEPDRVLDIAGLERSLPAVDECRVNTGTELQGVPLASLGHLELLEAGKVTIGTQRTKISLAPRAFPTVSAFVSGVMYTTRDQSPGPLPVGVPYRVQVNGSSSLPAFSLMATAPEPLDHVTINGLSLSELTTVKTGEPVDVTWAPSSSAPASPDAVVVELASRFNGPTVRCTFRDDAGVGSIPARFTRALDGGGRLVVHRIRQNVRAMQSKGLDSARIEFDFDVNRDVTFQSQS